MKLMIRLDAALSKRRTGRMPSFPSRTFRSACSAPVDDPSPRIGMAIGDHAFDLKKASAGSERFAEAIRTALQEDVAQFAVFTRPSGAARATPYRRRYARSGTQRRIVRQHASDLLVPMQRLLASIFRRRSPTTRTSMPASIMRGRLARC